MSAPRRDPWVRLSDRTPARIGLGRAGVSLPTRELLAFGMAHARARDAVHTALDVPTLVRELAELSLETMAVASCAGDRVTYLSRPDLGRRLDASSRRVLDGTAKGTDLTIVIADGLSAVAVQRHAVPVVAAFLPIARKMGWSMGPVVIACGARVALGDDIAAALQSRLVAIFIGERPGLSAPDSLGIYLTHDPHPGRTDAERNCLSNIRPEGLAYDRAAAKLVWLIDAARKRGLTGVALKDESDTTLTADRAPRLET